MFVESINVCCHGNIMYNEGYVYINFLITKISIILYSIIQCDVMQYNNVIVIWKKV